MTKKRHLHCCEDIERKNTWCNSTKVWFPCFGWRFASMILGWCSDLKSDHRTRVRQDSTYRLRSSRWKIFCLFGSALRIWVWIQLNFLSYWRTFPCWLRRCKCLFRLDSSRVQLRFSLRKLCFRIWLMQWLQLMNWHCWMWRAQILDRRIQVWVRRWGCVRYRVLCRGEWCWYFPGWFP